MSNVIQKTEGEHFISNEDIRKIRPTHFVKETGVEPGFSKLNRVELLALHTYQVDLTFLIEFFLF